MVPDRGLTGGAMAVLATSVNQLDALAGLGADALVHGEGLPLECVVRAVDAIAQRQRTALRIIDLREHEAVTHG